MISCDGLKGIDRLRLEYGQMASSLSQIRVVCSTMKMSIFPLAIENNVQPWKAIGFYSSGEREIEKSLTAPRVSLRTDSPLWSFSRFWSSLIGIEVSNEEEYSILRILYCFSLQQHIFHAFCNDFYTHYSLLAYILFRKKTLIFPNDSFTVQGSK